MKCFANFILHKDTHICDVFTVALQWTYVYSRGGPQTALAPRPSLIYCALQWTYPESTIPRHHFSCIHFNITHPLAFYCTTSSLHSRTTYVSTFSVMEKSLLPNSRRLTHCDIHIELFPLPFSISFQPFPLFGFLFTGFQFVA
jgi:hypothetical protein